MELIQLFLPLRRRDGAPVDREAFDRTRAELVEQFGGLTAYSRAPADGLWNKDEGAPVKDTLVVYEVLCEPFDKAWWQDYRAMLERRFDQEQVLAFVQHVDVL